VWGEGRRIIGVGSRIYWSDSGERAASVFCGRHVLGMGFKMHCARALLGGKLDAL
jgi:hypothetical protein